MARATRSFKSVAEYPSVWVDSSVKLTGDLEFSVISLAISSLSWTSRDKIWRHRVLNLPKKSGTGTHISSGIFIRSCYMNNFLENMCNIYQRMKRCCGIWRSKQKDASGVKGRGPRRRGKNIQEYLGEMARSERISRLGRSEFTRCSEQARNRRHTSSSALNSLSRLSRMSILGRCQAHLSNQ